MNDFIALIKKYLSGLLAKTDLDERLVSALSGIQKSIEELQTIAEKADQKIVEKDETINKAVVEKTAAEEAKTKALRVKTNLENLVA